ncbi:MAG TPA: 16S rRNA (cytosine(967)-C(5))-methyltransferase RsmB [Polyangia bacterium]|jgi:16S rRNA (cytosine967-C5)-methyltransferase|nr:16S rRNA (cytosine(967)-C(5))-methyltransferase RsmB [Polyangia bacterium]
MTGRELARAVLERVEQSGSFANRALSAALDRAPTMSASDRGLATELVYGVLRRRARLDRALDALAPRGLGGVDPRARIALRVGAYQILFLDRIPAYAAVNETVDACKRLGAPGVGRLANALLRRLAERGEPPLPDRAGDPRGHLVEAAGLPQWLARLLLDELPPAEAVAFGDSVSTPAPLALRANGLRATRDEVLARLRAERPDAVLEPSPLAPDAVLARGLEGLAATEAWREGLVSVEDTGAQLVVELCGARPGERILDACAGSGGKSAHLAALAENGARVDAVDLSAPKLSEARQSFARLGVTGVTTTAADLTTPFGDGVPFDRVLLDAPCSGLGVLRRHPEALGRRTYADLPRLAGQQARLLATVAPLVALGGTLTYSVCTFDEIECEDVVAAFLGAHPDFRVEAPPPSPRVPWARLVDAAGFVRTWPHRDDADAFFAARLVRWRKS